MKEKGVTTAVMAAAVVVILIVAGVGAYIQGDIDLFYSEMKVLNA